MFSGFGMNLSNLSLVSDAESRTISPENRKGAKSGACLSDVGTGAAAASKLGLGWKVSPSLTIQSNEIITLADYEGMGSISQIWMTVTGNWRHSILRMYWDGQEQPSVECPVGHFFCAGWNKFAQVSALPVNVNPGKAFACYWAVSYT